MKTFFLVPFLMFLSALGLYSSPNLASYSRPPAPLEAKGSLMGSEIVRPATPKDNKLPTGQATKVTSSTRVVTTSARKPVTVVVQKTAPAPQPTSQPKLPTTTSVSTPAPSAPAPTPSPTATPAANSYASEIEQNVSTLMNAERIKNGLPALTWDTRLADMARAHSADMLAKNYFSHTDKNGCGSSCRANNAGYGWTAIGENIYMTDGYNLTSTAEAEMIVQGWMNSPGHRANILGAQFTNSGVGVAVQGEKIYITAMYSKPR